MKIRKAKKRDLDSVKNIAFETMISIYPKYYPRGAVDFFINYHSSKNIANDIKLGKVFIGEVDGVEVGTVTINRNEVNRLFVLPNYQGEGYGKSILKFSEDKINENYNKIVIDASLPAKGMYLKRGYEEVTYKTILTENGDYLCYDIMEKKAS